MRKTLGLNESDPTFRRQWQVLQLPPLQPPQADEAEVLIRLLAAPLSPPLLKAQTDMTRCTFAESHRGQLTVSSLLKTNCSNFSQHWQHSYS
jgi:hypothetical protein